MVRITVRALPVLSGNRSRVRSTRMRQAQRYQRPRASCGRPGGGFPARGGRRQSCSIVGAAISPVRNLARCSRCPGPTPGPIVVSCRRRCARARRSREATVPRGMRNIAAISVSFIPSNVESVNTKRSGWDAGEDAFEELPHLPPFGRGTRASRSTRFVRAGLRWERPRGGGRTCGARGRRCRAPPETGSFAPRLPPRRRAAWRQ